MKIKVMKKDPQFIPPTQPQIIFIISSYAYQIY
jgi:hypothetical protein